MAMRRWIGCVGVAFLVLAGGCNNPGAGKPTTAPVTEKWHSLFDGKTLGNWKSTNFGGEAEPKIANGVLTLPEGAMLSGVNWEGDVPMPTSGYEISLEAQRVQGNDFFVGLTFPVKDSFASLICGGWGGGLCGISSLNDDDAARNETATSREFKNGQWYQIRMRVEPERLQAWIDKEQIVDVNIKEKIVGLRAEVIASKPLGLATFQTTGAFRNVKWRLVD